MCVCICCSRDGVFVVIAQCNVLFVVYRILFAVDGIPTGRNRTSSRTTRRVQTKYFRKHFYRGFCGRAREPKHSKPQNCVRKQKNTTNAIRTIWALCSTTSSLPPPRNGNSTAQMIIIARHFRKISFPPSATSSSFSREHSLFARWQCVANIYADCTIITMKTNQTTVVHHSTTEKKLLFLCEAWHRHSGEMGERARERAYETIKWNAWTIWRWENCFSSLFSLEDNPFWTDVDATVCRHRTSFRSSTMFVVFMCLVRSVVMFDESSQAHWAADRQAKGKER